jgi:MFS family permease
MLAGGAGIVFWNVITVSLRQRITPDRLLGRMNASYRLVGWGTMPLGAALGGVLAEALGLRGAFLVAALLTLAVLAGFRFVTEEAITRAEAAEAEDLEEVLGRLLPRDDRWAHRHGSRGHGADHLLPVFAGPSLTVPVQGGRLLLGTWQRICLVDVNDDNPRRRVRLSFLAG